MNLVLAVFLVAVINMVGTQVPVFQTQKPVIGWIEPDSPADKANLEIDDEILSIDGKVTETWNDVDIAVGSKPKRVIDLEVKREGEIEVHTYSPDSSLYCLDLKMQKEE